jgi:hypothetical protein
VGRASAKAALLVLLMLLSNTVPRSKLDIYLLSQRFTTHEENTFVAQIAKTFQGVSRILKGDKIIEGESR